MSGLVDASCKVKIVCSVKGQAQPTVDLFGYHYLKGDGTILEYGIQALMKPLQIIFVARQLNVEEDCSHAALTENFSQTIVDGFVKHLVEFELRVNITLGPTRWEDRGEWIQANCLTWRARLTLKLKQVFLNIMKQQSVFIASPANSFCLAGQKFRKETLQSFF